MKQLLFLLYFVVLGSCTHNTENESPLFILQNESIGISFENTLTYTESFNPYVYRNFYNGGGVAIGDINNDGLEDIFFTGNMVDNKLYLNKGNWKFEDITLKSGVACPEVWSTGATFADVNGDGFLDLYVCKSGKPGGANRHNELFINNGDLTFTESAKDYGLAVEGLSVHSAFFDFDKDGDLDAYILNNSIKSIGGFDLIKDQRNIPDPMGNGNKLYRNDDGKFVDITQEAGIYSSKIGFGLGITIGDFNNDTWPDIFISNDFFEKDYLYLNNKQGGFSEQIENSFESISLGSMGADFADLNNDLLNDLFVTEMLPQTLNRQKTKTIFESWNKRQFSKKQGYFNQYSRNTLQRNLGNNTFLEIGRQSKVAATEWSWASLLFDMNNDGLRDIYVSNGVYKDLLDRDYLNYEANEETIRNRINSSEKNVIKKLIDAMPSQAVSNQTFKNLGEFQFENKNKDWGLEAPSFSNGSAYADLDNDGDLDLIVNNVNMPSFVYKNTTDTLQNRSVTLKLETKGKNIFSIGSQAVIKYGEGKMSVAQNYPSRGFQSSIPSTIHFGVGNTKYIDTLWVTWADGSASIKTNLTTNTTHTITQNSTDNNLKGVVSKHTNHTKTKEIAPLFNFEHKENSYVDFNNERLLSQMYSNEGPALATYDLNNDDKIDFFLGGAKNQSAKLFLSTDNAYQEIETPFVHENSSEDTDAIFFDADNDGDMDLYVCHGGKAFSPYSIALNDSFYINENNTFVKSEHKLPFSKNISSSVVTPSDYDLDGDIDLFVGERFKTNLYGLPGSGYLLENDGNGKFTILKNDELSNIGMITDASWADINNDNKPDLVVLGEWMSIKIFINQNGILKNETNKYNLTNTSGLWTSIYLEDIDNDGDQDIIAGNIGRNSFYEPNMRMYINDFDKNGFGEQIICKRIDDNYYPIADKDELISQIPSLKKDFLYYQDYANADITTIFNTEEIKGSTIYDLKMVESSVFINEDGKFKPVVLPNEIQYSPIYSITSKDVNKDGFKDIFFGGNQYMVKPQFGSYDASNGWVVFGPLTDKTKSVESLGIKGQIRELEWVDYKNEKILIAVKNNAKTSFHTLKDTL
ncbi:VCBS repeat-containing protein [Zobellia nedashkovskayae]|uniref:VCBS repeat-containing protein n=1 Tax=Zobellia nedashkovskayae TaxID=2779510 RepID=UPI00188C9402|nr:VCBS repeat-containing protein [Zobellia nedashkovskayae]